MAIDMRRVVLAAVQAALEDPHPDQPTKRSRLATGRALVLGAGLVTAGRLVAGSRARDILEGLQQRLDANGLRDQDASGEDQGFDEDDGYYQDEAYEDLEGPEAEEEPPTDVEPEAEEEPEAAPSAPRARRANKRTRGRART